MWTRIPLRTPGVENRVHGPDSKPRTCRARHRIRAGPLQVASRRVASHQSSTDPLRSVASMLRRIDNLKCEMSSFSGDAFSYRITQMLDQNTRFSIWSKKVGNVARWNNSPGGSVNIRRISRWISITSITACAVAALSPANGRNRPDDR